MASIPYKVFTENFLEHPSAGWHVHPSIRLSKMRAVLDAGGDATAAAAAAGGGAAGAGGGGGGEAAAAGGGAEAMTDS